MSQYDPGTIDATKESGTDLANLLNNLFPALFSCHSGPVAPTYAVAGLWWLDTSTTPWALKQYDGAAWIELGAIDPTEHSWTVAVPDATETVAGKVLLAAGGGTLAGTAVQGDDSRLAPATESNAGILKLATQAQIDAGTDDATAVTPAKLAGRLSALGTAATQNVGTAAGNVVQLDASGALPAVSGENLTGIAGIPVGSVVPVASATVPTGYLECNGAAVSRTAYADLFAAIGTIHGTGDGGTTFNLPDYRGRFLRGWDHGAGRDPDRAGRTAMASGGATSDAVGTVQSASVDASGIKLQRQLSINSSHTVDPYASSSTDLGATATNTHSSGTYWEDLYISSSGLYRFISGNETRPINANVMYCIKY